MRRIAFLTAVMSVCGVTALGAQADETGPADQTALTKTFDGAIQPNELRDWLKQLASQPNHVGSPHDKANAEWILAQFKAWGWDAHIEQFEVLYPTPVHESLELVGAKPFKATLQEPPIKGDSSATATQPALPAYLAYQGDGDVKGGLVYVNYGMKEDYDTLERLGVSVKGKIVIVRYGSGWRGLKPKLAYEHGAIGCIIYSDPHDDGYALDAVYPKGPQRPPRGFQRGSVQDMTLYPGDPLTPDTGATKDAKRLKIADAPTILKIPAIPISYADAKVFLSALDGQVAPESWRGSLPITYRVGSGKVLVHLAVKSDWSLKPIYDVIAVMKGAAYPDQWIIRGNHHDGWVFGGSDPLSGQVALLAEAKAIGALVRQGWRPKRTIVYGSWDGEEPGLLGSTEWAETHADELKHKGVLYINSDNNARGFLEVGGSQDLEHFVDAVAAKLTDPETGVSVDLRRRAKLRIDAVLSGAKDKDHQKAVAKMAANPDRDTPIEALGSGSDYAMFLQHLGLPALDVRYGDEGDSGGVYHSRYDTFEHHSRFVDPGFVYDTLLARTIGHMVLAAADADVPVERAADFAEEMAQDVSEIKKIATDKREAAEVQAGLLRDRAFALAADPTKAHGTPDALLAVPQFDFAPLDAAVTRLKTSAQAYDDALAAHGATLSGERLARLQALMLNIDQTLMSDTGLPGRPWYRNLVYAPGTLTGYGAKTLPGVREAIEQQRWADANTYIGLTAGVLNAFSDRLDQATAVLDAP
ncbi:MAG: M28 family peptidase [Alphaproteobacteria bacterium]|nr:M28 family peptidase [Alphaproteobacteria bacterium]